MSTKCFRWPFFLFLVSIVSALLVQPVLAQGDAFRFEIRRNATPQAYYVHVLFQGADPADITTVPKRGSVSISYKAKKEQREQFDNGGVRFFSASQALSSRIGIPPDGDVSQIRRIDKPGWIQLIIPRRMR